MTAQFVILHHTGYGCEHWDLMLEHENALLTWQLLTEPAGSASLPISARRLDDHRKAYLDYEGPVSKDRGIVRRIDGGGLKIEKLTGQSCYFVASGKLIAGSLVLSKDGETTWTLASSSHLG